MAALAATTLAASDTNTTVDLHELDRVIGKAQQNAWDELKDDNWNFPTYLGTWFLSEYFFELEALEVKKSKFNQTFFT